MPETPYNPDPSGPYTRKPPVTEGFTQIFTGAAPPAEPSDPTKAALFYPSGGGQAQEWDVASQTWL